MEQNNLDNCIVNSLDGTDVEILPYIPYILQDILEIGTDSEIMSDLVLEFINIEKPRILDVCCGKGVVSIKIAQKTDASIRGIDAVPQFIEEAVKISKQYEVDNRCDFVVGDVRELILSEKGFDVVVLGAIGNVLGSLYETLSKASNVLNPRGFILIDDGYIPDNSTVDYNRCLRESVFYQQIRSAGFFVKKELIFGKDEIESSDMVIFEGIEKRSKELMEKYPDKKRVFQEYIKKQEYENHMLENELVTGIWLLQKNY